MDFVTIKSRDHEVEFDVWVKHGELCIGVDGPGQYLTVRFDKDQAHKLIAALAIVAELG